MFLPMNGEFLLRRQCMVISNLVDDLFPGKAETCLEIGCSRGDALPYLEAVFPNVTAVDVDSAKLADAQRRAGPNTRLVPAKPNDGGEIRYPLDDSSFDVVVSLSLLHHLDNKARITALGEVRRLLKPHGLAILFEYNPVNPLAALTMAFGEEDHGAKAVFPNTLKQLFHRCGLEPLRFQYVLFFPASLKRLMPFESYLGRLPLGGKYLIAGRPS